MCRSNEMSWDRVPRDRPGCACETAGRERKSRETMRTIATFRRVAESLTEEQHRQAGDESFTARACRDRDDLSMTAALLRVGRAVSFATPGHRRGRSCDPGR
jgi:hypothetical protein